MEADGRWEKKGATLARSLLRSSGPAREVRGVTQAAALYMLKNLDMEIRLDSSPTGQFDLLARNRPR